MIGDMNNWAKKTDKFMSMPAWRIQQHYQEAEDDWTYFCLENYWTKEQQIRDLEKATTYDMGNVDKSIDLKEAMNRIFNDETISKRYRQILYNYFIKGYTLEDNAKIFDITKERVRQILAKTMRMLRHPCRRKYLDDLVS